MIPAMPPPEIPESSSFWQTPVVWLHVYQVSSSEVVGHSAPDDAVSSHYAQTPLVLPLVIVQTLVVQSPQRVQITGSHIPDPYTLH